MKAKQKKELILEGLECANCATKIETEINKISGVTATMNFMTKTLSLETEGGQDLNGVLKQVNSIVNRIESHVIVKEKLLNKGAKKTLILMGLDCANCAAKIENQVKNISGVRSSTVDFMSKKLIIEADSNHEMRRIVDEATAIVNRLEPDVKVIDNGSEAKQEKKVDETSEEISYKKEYIQLGVGGGLFLLGSILSLPNWAELSIFFIAYLIVGGEVLLRAIKNIFRGQVFDENFLMAIATIGAFIIGEFPEGVGVMLFYQVGELFQSVAVNRSRKSISSLMDIRPDFANLKVGSAVKKVTPEEVAIGDIIVVKPGEKVPLDGKVISGTSMMDTSALTGESVPREVEAGNEVLSGFINKNGVLEIEVAKEFGESTVSKILDLVQNASSKKAQAENFITKFARYYTPVVVITAAAIAVIPPMVVSGAVFSDWLYRALIFLVISCPCALVISIPLGFFGGIGGASKRGVLVKGSNYLEALNDVETVVFDKTGTLTKGVFKVTEIKAKEGYAKEELLELAAFAESYSNHPIAVSIIKAYGKEIDKDRINSYEEVSGHGTKVVIKEAKALGEKPNFMKSGKKLLAGSARVIKKDKEVSLGNQGLVKKGKEILAGNIKLMKQENISYDEVTAVGTVVHLAVNKEYAGYIVISDEVKEDSAKAIQSLKALGVKRTVMLTGDAKVVGEKVGKELGLDQVYAELLPTDKVEKLEALDKEKSPKGKLVFVGDGINDAPVLARADIGIAMGGLGSDAAIEAADIVIMTDEPSKIADAIKIAKRTKTIVWQNIVFALGVKGIFLILGAFGIATMWEAVFADVGVSVIAILNAMRVMKVEKL